MDKKIIKLEFEFPVVKDEKNRIVVRMDVRGMMGNIKSKLEQKGVEDAELLLEEYAKFWVTNKAGIKTTPLKK